MNELTIDDLLLAHAAGRLPEPVGLLVASHLTLAPQSRRAYARYEAVGGALLDEIEPEPLSGEAWKAVQGRLESRPSGEPSVGRRVADCGSFDDGPSDIPRPLRAYLPGNLETLNWRNYGPVSEADLSIDCPGYRSRLILLKAGRAVPKHTHEGQELTLVLRGAFRDGIGHYRRGDVAIADASIDHRPMADRDRDCLCFAVTDAPLRLTGRFGRLLSPFVRL